MLGTAIRVVTLLVLLAILGGIVLAVLTLASLANAPSQIAGGVGGDATRALTSARQALQDATDPNHPPGGLAYDTEFSSLSVWRVGDHLPDGREYVLTLQSVKRREGADSPQTALYATVHAELRQPRETRVLGQLLRSDSDAHEYVVYTGESFRIGRALYRVNWISQDDNAMAAGVYRQPDSVSAPLKFQYD